MTRIYAKYRKRIASGDQFVKSSEYAKEFGAKNASQVPGTDINIYERPSTFNNSWQKQALATEKTSSYKRQYPGTDPQPHKLEKDRDLRSGFKNRNGNIIGNSYAAMENSTQLRRSFLSPDTQIRCNKDGQGTNGSRLGSARSVAVKFPYGYRSPLESKTSYKTAFVDHHVKHCHCPN